MSLKSAEDWEKQGVFVGQGASIGAGSVCIAPVRVGKWSMVGAGAVVTRDVPDHALVVGNPAKRISWIDRTGIPLKKIGPHWVSEEGSERYQEVSPQSLKMVTDESA
jgi:serine acetyltransferase